MKSPVELRHDHLRQLYFSERAKREGIRGSIATPLAAIAFVVFSLGTLATEFDAARWREPASLAIIALGLGSVLALFMAAYHAVMVEWLFVYHEPPGLDDLLAAEDRIRAENPEAAETQLTELLTAGYAIAYRQYLCGNVVSARARTWSLRYVLLSLLLLALSFALLPLHLAG